MNAAVPPSRPLSETTVNRLRWIAPILLTLVTLAVFWPVTWCDFINYDDPQYVTSNTFVQNGLTWENVRWAFQTGHASNWHPITWLSHMLDCELYGLKPSGHHFTNLIFHGMNTLLLLFILNRMTSAFWASTIVAALFALHPLHVESVAWVAERKDVLSTFFGLISILFYVCYVGNRKGAEEKRGKGESPNLLRSSSPFLLFYVLALLFFALSLMSKPMLVTLPCVLLLLDFWPLTRLSTSNLAKLFCEKLPFIALTIASSIITFLVQQQAGAVRTFDLIPLSYRIINSVVAYLRYVGKTFWPAKLAVFYPAPDGWPLWQVTIGALLLLSISILVFLKRNSRPALFTGWFWFVGTLVPVIGIIQVGAQSMADRYSYVPIIGLFIVVVWSAKEIIAARPLLKIPFIIGVVSGLAGCALCTKAQLIHWKNSADLFRHALLVTTNNYVAHINLGSALKDLHQDDEAMVHYQAALEYGPNLPETRFGIAEISERKNLLTEAAQQYTAILASHPKNALARNNLGSVMQKLGNTSEAIKHYKLAIEIDPNYAEVRYNLASALSDVGRHDEAITQFQEALRLKPMDANARNNLAIAFADKGDFENATIQLREALKVRPNDAETHFNLSYVLAKAGKRDEAKHHYDTALQLNPLLLQNKK